MRLHYRHLLPWFALSVIALVATVALGPMLAPPPQPTLTPMPSATPTAIPTALPTSSPTPIPTVDPGRLEELTGRILFTSVRNDATELYAIDANGRNLRQLTDNRAADWVAKWSPDGDRIAFVSNRDGDYEIFVMNADGSNPIQLTHNEHMDTSPVWSSKGDLIAFSSWPEGGFDVYVMRPDGQGVLQLGYSGTSAEVHAHSWSADGVLLLSAEWDGDFEIYALNVQTTDLKITQLTDNSFYDGSPDWSPDGKRVVFDSDRDGNGEIYVMDADGSNVVRLTNYPGQDYMPRWSPDGRHIGFTSSRDGNSEVYVMDADGSNLTRITQNAYLDILEDWK